jgi:hypothetical protein
MMEYPIKIAVDSAELATILAALRYYQQEGCGDPNYRSDAIHEIATDGGNETSLDSDGIDSLCERINTSGSYDDDSGRPNSSEDSEEDYEDDESSEDDEDEDEDE